MSESDTQRAIVSALTTAGYTVLRHQSGLARGWRGGRMVLCEPGTPDLSVTLAHGRVVWIETKYGKGKTRKSQDEWHAKHAALGHVIIVARDAQATIDAVTLCANTAKRRTWWTEGRVQEC